MQFGYLTSIVVSIAAIKLQKKKALPYLKGILTLPIFVLSWIPINVVACVGQRKQHKWEKVEHTKDVSIDKILEINYK